jgi:hypothetical protein
MEFPVICCLFLFFLAFLPRSDFHFPKWFLFTVLSAGFLCYQAATVSVTFALMMFYLMAVASFWGRAYFPKKIDLDKHVDCLHSLMGMFSCLIIFNYFPMRWFLFCVDAIPVALVLNCLYGYLPAKTRTVSSAFEGQTHIIDGIGSNTSHNATLSSILCDLYLSTSPLLIGAFISIASVALICIRTQGIAGSLALMVSGFLWAISVLGAWSLIIPAVFAAFVWPNRKKHFNPSGRDVIWKNTLYFWKLLWKHRRHYVIFGIGQGAYRTLYPRFEQITKKDWKGQRMAWAHNDFLQFFMEAGLIGCALGIAFAVAIACSVGYSDLIFLSAFCISMIFNAPLRFANECFVATMFLKLIFSR